MVAGKESSYDRARQEANRREYCGSFAPGDTCTQTVWKLTGGWIGRASMEYPRTERRSYTGAHDAAD